MDEPTLSAHDSDRRELLAVTVRHQDSPTPVAHDERRQPPREPATPYDEIWYRGRPRDF